MTWANDIATKLAAALPVRMVELNNCYARAYVQAMAVCATGNACTAVVVRRGAFFEVTHPSGSYACKESVDGDIRDAICTTVRWDWHVATGVYPSSIDQIIDAGLRPQQPLMWESHWLSALGLAGQKYVKRFEIPGSLAMVLSRTLGRAVGPELSPWLEKPRVRSTSEMPRFSNFDISGARMTLNSDFDAWEAAYGASDGCCSDRRALFERYLDEWTAALKERNLIG